MEYYSTLPLAGKKRFIFMSTAMKTVVLTSNSIWNIYNFRKELVEKLAEKNNLIIITDFSDLGNEHILKWFHDISKRVRFESVKIDRRSVSIIENFLMFLNIVKILIRLRPNIVISFTIKNNIYMSFLRTLIRYKLIITITGRGSSQYSKKFTRYFINHLYYLAIKISDVVFVQNSSDFEYFSKVLGGNYEGKLRLVPGSGVDLAKLKPSTPPNTDQKIFLMVSRVLRSKGIVEFIEAAELTRKLYPNSSFRIVGLLETSGSDALQFDYFMALCTRAGVDYLGYSPDVSNLISDSNCVVLPSYSEGMSRVLLEACALGRPVIASSVAGCRELCIDSVNGFLVEPKDSVSLAEAFRKFIELRNDVVSSFGLNSRRLVEKNFAIQRVVDCYMKEVV